MRIDKFLSNLKFGTRKEVHGLVRAGLVTKNGEILNRLDEDISPTMDKIMVGDETVFYKPTITLMMNKPIGVVSANQDMLYPTVIDLIDYPYSRFDFNIAGRLDKDTTGFLLLTTDGSILHQVISPNKEIYKTYLVTCEHMIEEIEKLEQGVIIKDGKNEDFLTKPAVIHLINDTTMEIQILEGKFHQVKRMVEAINNQVILLKRIKIGNLDLDNKLEPGAYREVTEQEILQIFH